MVALSVSGSGVKSIYTMNLQKDIYECKATYDTEKEETRDMPLFHDVLVFHGQENHSKRHIISWDVKKNNCSDSAKYRKKNHLFDKSWQTYLAHPMERLSYILENSAMSDITIQLQDGKELKLHKLILSLYSPVYATMFHGSFPQEERMTENTSYEVFWWLAAYMYKGVFTLPSVQLALELYIFVHQKQMQFVLQICSTYLLAHVDSENALQVMEIATLFEDQDLKQECTKIIFSRRRSIFLTEELHDASQDVILVLLKSGQLKFTERTIFKTVFNWVVAQIKSRNEAVTPQTIRKGMDSFVPLIDFLSMSTEFYVKEVLSTNIFTPEEGMAILRRQRHNDAPIPKVLSMAPMIRRIRLNSESSIIQRVELIKKPMCNFTFLHNHNHDKFSDKIFVMTISEKIFLCSVRVRSSCYSGSWQLCITDRSDRHVGSTSSEGPPWNFETMIPLAPDATYVGKIIGKGKIAKHSIDEYTCNMNGICFSGMAVACKLGIVYWT